MSSSDPAPPVEQDRSMPRCGGYIHACHATAVERAAEARIGALPAQITLAFGLMRAELRSFATGVSGGG
jgi:hypothetical protein